MTRKIVVVVGTQVFAVHNHLDQQEQEQERFQGHHNQVKVQKTASVLAAVRMVLGRFQERMVGCKLETVAAAAVVQRSFEQLEVDCRWMVPVGYKQEKLAY